MKNIFIIDDDPTSNYICKLIISSQFLNADIKSFINPIEALQNIEKLNAGIDSLIILDLNMPEMNGYQFLEKIEEKGLKCPVIILTSSKNLMENEYAKKYKQVKAFLTKPFTSESMELFSMLN